MFRKRIFFVILVFICIIGATFYAAYMFANKASKKTTSINSANVTVQQTSQQVRKITFKNLSTGETTELWADGTVNYYDKTGKLKKTGRRGFAETISKFRDLERLINANKKIAGMDGYQINIDTEQGTIVVNPGDQGDGDDVVDDIFDYIDHTLHPTPTPPILPTPIPSPTPTTSTTPSPNPSGDPSPTDAPPFTCADYYKSGKSIKISNIICGPEPTP